MYFFFHLITGIILGFLLAELLCDRRWIIPCSIGAVLPDLIDKPLGHIIFASTLGYGRIYCHTLLFFLIIMVIGITVWKYWKSPIFLALSVGIFSHSILDLMWLEMQNWLYPFMGPFGTKLSADYFITLINGELANTSEGILVILIGAGFLVYLAHGHSTMKRSARFYRILKNIMKAVALVLCMVSGIVIGLGLDKTIIRGMRKMHLAFIGWSHPEEFIIGGIVIAIAAWLVWRWQDRIGEQPAQ